MDTEHPEELSQPRAVNPAPSGQSPPNPPPAAPAEPAPAAGRRFWLLGGIGVAVVVLIAGALAVTSLFNTVSTDDAYINGHVTFVAARVPGQVQTVYVDDNNRVHKGDRLLELDRTPYLIAAAIAQQAVAAAQSDLVVAQAQARALEGQTRAARFNLEHAIEDVDNQIELLKSKVATLNSQQAVLVKAQADYDRVLPLSKVGAATGEDLDNRRAELLVAQAQVAEALQGVYEVRVSLGQHPKPDTGDDLTQVPADLDQTFSTVQQAQASLIQSAAQLGVVSSFAKTPRQLVDDFYKRDPEGNIDRIYDQILKDAPGVHQAQAKLAQAQANLDQANLNLSYCTVWSEIDGVVTRRDVNPGNNIVAGQSLMAVRSLTDIWVDANFKETQLADIRIGSPVDLDVDMYGSRQHFKGRVSGFTMGTGSTLALLPAENATGNFVKVVQRLPVRIDLIDYDPDKVPLFIGLSVTPTVYINEPPTGPSAGKVLQPFLVQPQSPATLPATLP